MSNFSNTHIGKIIVVQHLQSSAIERLLEEVHIVVTHHSIKSCNTKHPTTSSMQLLIDIKRSWWLWVGDWKKHLVIQYIYAFTGGIEHTYTTTTAVIVSLNEETKTHTFDPCSNLFTIPFFQLDTWGLEHLAYCLSVAVRSIYTQLFLVFLPPTSEISLFIFSFFQFLPEGFGALTSS